MDIGAVANRVVDLLLGLGIPGVVIVGLSYLLYRSMAANEARDKVIADLQEKRVLERTTMLQALADNSTAMAAVAAATEDNNRALESIRQAVDALARSVDLMRGRS